MSSQKATRKRFEEEALPHLGALFRTALRIAREQAEAEDLVQETYKEAWGSFHRYRPGTNCKAWLFRILFRRWSRRLRRINRLTQVDLEEVSEERLAVMPDFEARLAHETVLDVLNSLPEHYQLVLILADVEGFSYREIADQLELPVGTVMSRLNRARNLLRQKLLEVCEESRSA